MWRSGHDRRLAAPPLRGHSGADRALDGRESLPKRTFRKLPGGFPTSCSP